MDVSWELQQAATAEKDTNSGSQSTFKDTHSGPQSVHVLHVAKKEDKFNFERERKVKNSCRL